MKGKRNDMKLWWGLWWIAVLVEIIFEKVGTKRLMLKSASQYMKKSD